MRQQITAIEAGPTALAVRALSAVAHQRLGAAGAPDQPAAPDSLAWLAALTDVLAVEDHRFLNTLKLTLQAGAQVFEAHEQHTLTRGRRALLEAIQNVPAVLADYFARVAVQLKLL